jgi:hypothetical protein
MPEEAQARILEQANYLYPQTRLSYLFFRNSLGPRRPVRYYSQADADGRKVTVKEAVTHRAGHRGANQATDAIESDTPWGPREKVVFKLGYCLAGQRLLLVLK